jgi:Ni/Co efflux regulator RcnB
MKKLLTALVLGLFLAAGMPVMANQAVANENASEQGKKMSSEKAGDKAQKGKKDKKGKKKKGKKDNKGKKEGNAKPAKKAEKATQDGVPSYEGQ